MLTRARNPSKQIEQTKTEIRTRGRRARTFLVLDLRLDGGDSVAALDLEDDGLPRKRLHEDLHHRLLLRDLTHQVRYFDEAETKVRLGGLGAL